MEFEVIFKQVLKWEAEKGLTNDPDDAGGLTNDGLTWKHYYLLCKRVLNIEPSLAHFEAMPKADISAFYWYSYKESNCAAIEDKLVGAVCFDFAVNSKFAKREIQRLLREVGYDLNADNVFGPLSIAAINQATKRFGTVAFCKMILDKRTMYVNGLVKRKSSQKKFLKGWLNRINDWREFVAKNVE